MRPIAVIWSNFPKEVNGFALDGAVGTDEDEDAAGIFALDGVVGTDEDEDEDDALFTLDGVDEDDAPEFKLEGFEGLP